MSFEMPVETWRGGVTEITVGATEQEGGTREKTVTVGGATTLPFLDFEGKTSRPAIAMEVLDEAPTGWPEPLEQAFSDVYGDPAAWAQKCVQEYAADMICLRLVSADPDETNASPDQLAENVRSVLAAVGVPLVVWGCGNYAKDNDVWPIVSQAAAGERVVLASAEEDNYKTIAACAIADKHIVLNEAPLDINIQKQVTILLTDMGVNPDDIMLYQVTGGLGYGIEYAFSILERTRLAALGGDRMLAQPMLSVVGSEAWKVKEARLPEPEAPQWGPQVPRSILWEAATALTFLNAGTDILVMWHPEAISLVRQAIDDLFASAGS
jgi:acetyl-CoA decarbonylase/synthase complex subunit delta